MSELLRVENFHVAVGGKTLLHGINLTVNTGEVHVIMGVNGAGKSTLLHAIMGNPAYEITEGHVYFEGEDITELSTDKRARLGIFLSFQNPVSIAGITTENFIRTAKTTISGKQQRLFPFKRLLKSRMEGLAMDPSCGDRYLNDGFSGGERKKSEILQMRILEPKLAMLDETDSGLDVDAVRIVSRNISEFHNENNSLLLITHLNQILKFIRPELIHKANGKVWELSVSPQEARQWQTKTTVANLRHEGKEIILRIISDNMPSERAVPCEATLEDLYLFYFPTEEGVK